MLFDRYLYILLHDTFLFFCLSEYQTNDDLVFFKYAPLSFVDAKRSFSKYKNMLSDNRHKFTIENMKNFLIVQCNFQGKDW